MTEQAIHIPSPPPNVDAEGADLRRVRRTSNRSASVLAAMQTFFDHHRISFDEAERMTAQMPPSLPARTGRAG
jgi:hypothetical protein